MNEKIELKINDILYHPMSLDIIAFKVFGLTQYEDHAVYKAKALNNVGACGRVEVLLTVDRKNKVRFIGLDNDYEHDSGLQDFVEGVYYLNEQEARGAYYQIHKSNAWSIMNNAEKRYKETKLAYEKILNIINVINKDLSNKS